MIKGKYSTYKEIVHELESRGLGYEKWKTLDNHHNMSNDEIYKHYETEIDTIMKKYNFVKNDIITLTPNHEKKKIFRNKFLDEHIHTDKEVRYFIDGAACFYIHLVDQQEVIRIECAKGHLLVVPENTKHWFDMGPNPYFKVIRFFGIEDGWVAEYTQDQISKKFPYYDN